MKRLFTIVCIVVLSIVLSSSVYTQNNSIASGTPLKIYASGDFLNNIINANLASANPASEYDLVSTDTTYVFNGPITSNKNLTIVGVPNATTQRPPCIQPWTLADFSIPANLFVLNGSQTTATFSNLYLLGLSNDNQPAGTGTTAGSASGTAIQVSADSVSIVANKVIFEQWLGFAIGTSGNWTNVTVTNSVFRNMAHPSQYYVGEAFRNEWSASGTPMGNIVMDNNAFVCLNGYASAPVTKQICKYFEFCHNDVIYTAKNPLFIFGATTAKVDNNIFYGTYSIGVNYTENPWWDNLTEPDTTYSVIAFQPMDSVVGAQFGAGESARTIEVLNNNCYWPSAITSWWSTFNAGQTWSSTGNAILTPTWMNARTTAAFNDKTTYPHLNATGNTAVNPVFGKALDTVLTGGGVYGTGMIPWMQQIRLNAAPSIAWGYKMTKVDSTSKNWVPTWPLPEVADLKYTATLTGSDGKAVGDTNFVSGGSMAVRSNENTPVKFGLSAAYPNPFNPSTNFKFTIQNSGLINLKIYNILGQVVGTIVNNQFYSLGTYSIRIDMTNMASGVYFGVLEQGNNRSVQKMMLLK
ncbi:MAG TPA: T9SS type A sorting domain-containing protein [Bacteroidota bacterium]|nr:T9SS type A sorting domain-containing protein [Bacteroidota bacterium]